MKHLVSLVLLSITLWIPAANAQDISIDTLSARCETPTITMYVRALQKAVKANLAQKGYTNVVVNINARAGASAIQKVPIVEALAGLAVGPKEPNPCCTPGSSNLPCPPEMPVCMPIDTPNPLSFFVSRTDAPSDNFIRCSRAYTIGIVAIGTPPGEKVRKMGRGISKIELPGILEALRYEPRLPTTGQR